ncbi:alpha/beta hydrolase [Streptomyces sp. WI04-05B]|uniref:alpha/beta hydrolase n=1 Tax=Streptomyces TaxID=1883 RepID=UPI0029B2A8CC|nr:MULTISPECIES: alpha/beta hydrolase [unclassified Streptomyces]MDX2542242.1 alpha/beta hydrolase [Streptomyces sp. WI04-05B]MDX2584074.1 alpha/beta hydrolase [Streptomyces sp. WI04-05A]
MSGTRSRIALAVVATLTSVALTTLPSSAAQPDEDAAVSGHLTGTLSDGATWIADVPDDWNGTLLVFSHGFGTLVARNAPTEAVRVELLAKGYALAGSSYDPGGSMWALKSAARDQFATIDAVTAKIGKPSRTLAIGSSMGGLVNAQLARDGGGRIDGALGQCGLVAGATDLDNYQLDAEYTIARLLLPGQDVKLVRFGTSAEAATTADLLSKAVNAAQATPRGRARIALAAAFLNLPAWAPGKDRPAATDWAGQQEQQYAWFAQGILSFVEGGRYAIEQSVGGNNSWNRGVDYADLLAASQHAPQVRALYQAAGLDLRADLRTLTAGATITADPAAVRTAQRTSSAGQGLDVPLLDVHTTADNLVPVEQETRFAARVRASGDGALLRQAYVERQGHCVFTTAETVAALHALEHRVDTGRWDEVATPVALQKSATALGLDGAAYIPYRPAQLSVGRDGSAHPTARH